MKTPGYEADRFAIMAAPWTGSGTGSGLGEGRREVAPEWDRSAMSMTFDPDGASLLVIAQNLGQRSLFRVALADGAVTELVHDGTNGSPVPVGDQIVLSQHTLTHPTDLYAVAKTGGAPAPITSINEAKIAAARMGAPTQFEFKGARGDVVHGYVVQPADFDPAKRYPVAFLIHGGPQGSFGNMFHYRWNAQTYAGAGYAVVMIDFHGSTGYGQKFTDAIGGDWGGKPLVDLQRGLAHAEKTFPWLDGDRVCALGASYGGYMINWIEGNWPDRFKCLVNHDGVFDHRIMYYATEELWFPEREHGGPYYANPKQHEKHNPARFVDKWKTPMLVVHGALDFRVPPTQGLAAFTALQRRGIESELLFFPDENHWVLRPNNSVQWHETVLAWLDRHTKRK
jgi:dipeptidyl aminopeptidase/acylaminoacyl peptidase